VHAPRQWRHDLLDIWQVAGHPDHMRLTSFSPMRRRHVWLGTLALATSALLVIGTLGVSSGAGAQSVHHAQLSVRSKHKSPPKHKNKKKSSSSRPCLEGNWDVTTLTLSTAGLTFTGGAGTTVDIMSNGNALGNFTPGAPLTGSVGSAKFNGTITDHYGFSPKTTARSGTFPVTPVSNNATITVAGVTKPVTSVSEQGSYMCTGKDLTLSFTSGGSTLTYQMAPGS
jgi:hypothetical protein